VYLLAFQRLSTMILVNVMYAALNYQYSIKYMTITAWLIYVMAKCHSFLIDWHCDILPISLT
jgi:hypothetical protein